MTTIKELKSSHPDWDVSLQVDEKLQTLTFYFNFGQLWPDLLTLEVLEPQTSWQALLQAGSKEGAVKVSYVPIDDARKALKEELTKFAQEILKSYSFNSQALVLTKSQGSEFELTLAPSFKKSL